MIRFLKVNNFLYYYINTLSGGQSIRFWGISLMSTKIRTSNFNIAIRNYRKAFGYTQKELAQTLGVSTVTVQNWESGDTSPSMDALILLSRIFMVPIDNIVCNTIADGVRSEEISVEEILLIEDFRKLDERGKSTVKNSIKEQLKWM